MTPFDLWLSIPSRHRLGYNPQARYMSVSDRATFIRLVQKLPVGWTVGYFEEAR